MCGLSSPKVLYPILRRLEQLGFIRVCRNSNLEILFNVDASNSPTVIEVNDFDNIYAYYHNYLGNGRYVECSSCGKMVRVKGKWRKYCNECYEEKQLESDREYQKKKYNSKILDQFGSIFTPIFHIPFLCNF